MLITHPKYFQPEVVTALLRANKTLSEHEAITKLNPTNKDTMPETETFTFSVQYADFRTQRHAPDHLQLKIGKRGAIQARREVDFYTKIALPMGRRIDKDILRYPAGYDAYYDETSDQFHLVLEGASPEFKPAKNDAPPSQRQREQLVDTLATIHAYWWDHPLIGDMQPRPTEDSFNKRTQQLQRIVDKIKSSVGKYLNTAHLDVLAQVASGLPSNYRTRMLSGEGLTVIHGNLIPENLLYSGRDTLITNWEHWDIGFATDDLAMMMPMYWPQHLRDFQETVMLKRYYEQLKKHDVQDYTWDDLASDYQGSLANIIVTLLESWTLNKHTRGHWRKMERAIGAFIRTGGTPTHN